MTTLIHWGEADEVDVCSGCWELIKKSAEDGLILDNGSCGCIFPKQIDFLENVLVDFDGAGHRVEWVAVGVGFPHALLIILPTYLYYIRLFHYHYLMTKKNAKKSATKQRPPSDDSPDNEEDLPDSPSAEKKVKKPSKRAPKKQAPTPEKKSSKKKPQEEEEDKTSTLKKKDFLPGQKNVTPD